MQFCDYNEINLCEFHLNVPDFDSNYSIFVSNILNSNTNSIMNIKSGNLRLLNFEDDMLQIEFLYSSNNFYEFINNVDSQFKNEIIENGTDWFGDHVNIDTFNNIFKPSINLPTKLPGLPTMNFKCDIDCKITGKRRKKLSKSDLKQNMEIELHFVIEAIHFHKNKCHLIYNVKNIRVLNNICQTFESLFGENNYNQNNQNKQNKQNKQNHIDQIESEINNIITSTSLKV
jgi:hypothetical protein